jgi:hypothetical protein
VVLRPVVQHDRNTLNVEFENADGTSRYLGCQTEHGIATENEHSVVSNTHQCAIDDLGHS